MACDSVRFESCLVHEYCWFESDCTTTSQRNVAHFLKCFEGPYANREATPDATRRPLCAEKAGIDYQHVSACTANKTKVEYIEKMLNRTRAPMYSKLHPQGLFPHIFVNGVHLYNNSWASLVRVLCQKIGSTVQLDVCKSVPMDLTFYLWNTGLTISNVNRHADACAQAILEATNFVGSSEWLPINFKTSQPDHSPSYVNIKALDSVQLTSVKSINRELMQVKASIFHLKAFRSVLVDGIAGSNFGPFLAWALGANAFPNISSSNVQNQSATVPEHVVKF